MQRKQNDLFCNVRSFVLRTKSEKTIKQNDVSYSIYLEIYQKAVKTTFPKRYNKLDWEKTKKRDTDSRVFFGW